jgi:molybdate transport system substrate-binding protein
MEGDDRREKVLRSGGGAGKAAAGGLSFAERPGYIRAYTAKADLLRACALFILTFLALLVPGGGGRAQDGSVVFAAASLTDALRALGADWAARGNRAPRFSFAASSLLARQIEQGAPADLFLSADEAWADYIEARGLIAVGTRTSPIGNALVLVAGPGGFASVALERGTDLRALLGPSGRLATGDPAHVPVGRYAQAALTWMGQWDAVAPRLVRADNARAALLLVERGEAPLGIVYATDAAIASGLRVVGTFPPASHTPISYPFALLRRAEADARSRALLDFLAGPNARPVWRRFGFVVAP